MYLEPQTNPPPPLFSSPLSNPALTGRLFEQNNNSARASRSFVLFLAVPAQLTREMTKVWVDLRTGSARRLILLYLFLNSNAVPGLCSVPSLRKHPFLLALRRWGRFAKRPQRRRARRNGCFRRLFSSYLTSPPSSNWVAWLKGEKVLKDVKSIFQRRFHCCHLCRIVRSLMSKGQCTWQ